MIENKQLPNLPLYTTIKLILKCHYYAFSNITFHAVCRVAVCEHNFLQSCEADK